MRSLTDDTFAVGYELGESVTEALHRELWEEAAATITSEARIGVIS